LAEPLLLPVKTVVLCLADAYVGYGDNSLVPEGTDLISGVPLPFCPIPGIIRDDELESRTSYLIGIGPL